MKGYIRKLLKEALNEIDFGEHSVDRLIQRFETFNDEDVPPRVKQEVIQNLNLLKQNDLPKKSDYGIYLGGLSQNEINRDSIYYQNYLDGLKTLQHDTGRDRAYYSIGKGDEFFGDSTGNQFWLIVRGNTAATFMLRKDIQTQNSGDNKTKLMVDAIIKNLPEWIRRRKEANKPKSGKFKKLKLVDGNVVRYYADENKFETLEGQPIKVDDIFDSLPEDLQMKVMELMESKKKGK